MDGPHAVFFDIAQNDPPIDIAGDYPKILTSEGAIDVAELDVPAMACLQDHPQYHELVCRTVRNILTTLRMYLADPQREDIVREVNLSLEQRTAAWEEHATSPRFHRSLATLERIWQQYVFTLSGKAGLESTWLDPAIPPTEPYLISLPEAEYGMWGTQLSDEDCRFGSLCNLPDARARYEVRGTPLVLCESLDDIQLHLSLKYFQIRNQARDCYPYLAAEAAN